MYCFDIGGNRSKERNPCDDLSGLLWRLAVSFLLNASVENKSFLNYFAFIKCHKGLVLKSLKQFQRGFLRIPREIRRTTKTS